MSVKPGPALCLVCCAFLAPAAAAQALDCAHCHTQPHTIAGTAHAAVGSLTCHPGYNKCKPRPTLITENS